jgi:hypothetical protein
MNERVRPKRTGLSAAVLVAVLGCAATPVRSSAQSVDLAPLLEVHPDLSNGMARAFPDYEALVLRGVQKSNGKPSRNDVVELVQETFDTELDESNTWSVGATLTLFDTAASAARDLDASCYSFAHGGASAPVRSRDGMYCISPVLHVRSQASNIYSSWVIVRNDRLVVRLYERHAGSPKSAKNRIIAEIAARLSQLQPPAPPQ